MSVVHVETPKTIAVATPETVKVSDEKKNNAIMTGIMQAGPRDAAELKQMLEWAFPESSLVSELPFFASTVPPPVRMPRVKREILPLRNRFSVLKCERLPREVDVPEEPECCSVAAQLMRDPGEPCTCRRAPVVAYPAHRRRVAKYLARVAEDEMWEEAKIFNEGLALAKEYDRRYGVFLSMKRTGAGELWNSVVHEKEPVERVVRCALRSKRSRGPWFRRSLRLSRMRVALEKEFAKKLQKFVMSGAAQWGFDVNVKTDGVHHEHVLQIPLVSEMISKLSAHRGDVDWKIVLIEVGYFFLHLAQGGFSVKNLLLCASHLLLRIGKQGMSSLFERIVQRMPVLAQSVESVLSVLGIALAGCVSMLTVFLFSRLPADAQIDKFINRFSRVGACFTSMEKLQGVSQSATNVVMNFVKSELFGMSSDDLKEFADVDKFCDEVMAINTANLSSRCQDDTGELRQKVNTWLLQADGIQKRLDALRVPSVMTGRFRSVSLFLFKVRDTLDSTAPGLSQARIAPLLIHIHGQTGVGKSSMLDYLNTRLLVAMGSKTETDLHNKVYYRNPGSEFWDGFNNGSEIVVCDDFGSVADSAQHPSPEPIEAIRMMNTCPFKPQKADLSGKATAQFTARVVIWTSNRNKFYFPSLTNPEAVANRVQLRFRHYPHPDFAIEKLIGDKKTITLNSAKVAEAAKTNPNAWRDCMMFDQEDTEGVPLVATANYRVLREGLTFEEMAEICTNELMQKQEVGGAMRGEREKYYAACVGRAQAPMEGSPFPEDLFDVNTAELELLSKHVKYEFPTPTYFEHPTRIGCWFGSHVHLNVFKFIADCGLHGDVAAMFPAGDEPLDQVQKAFMHARCISYLKSDEPEILSLVYRTWRGIFRGESELAVQNYLTRIQTLSPFPFDCKRHDDPEAVETFAAMCRAKLTENLKSGLLRNVRFSQMLASWSPIVSVLYSVLSSYLVYRALKWAVSWLFEQLWRGVTNVKSWFGWKAVECDSEAYPSGTVAGTKVVTTESRADGVKTKPVVKTESAYPGGAVKGNTVVKTEGFAEALTDQNAAEIRTKVAKNMYHIFTRESGDGAWLPIGSLTFVRGRVAITNRHLHYVMKKHVRIVSTAIGERTYEMLKTDLNVGFADDQCSTYGERDACLIEFPLSVNAHADIFEFFMTSEDFSRHVEPKRVCLVKYTALGCRSTLMYQETDAAKAFDSTPFDLQYGDGTVKRVRSFYCYRMETQGGDCGGVLIAFDPRFNRKICGVHMAGGALGMGYTAAAVAVSQGFIDHVRARMTLHISSWFDGAVKVARPLEAEASDGLVTFNASLPGLVLHGTATSKVYAAKDTSISPSPVHEICGPVMKRPAYLRDTRNQSGVVVTPLATAMKKVSTPSMLIDQSALAAAKKQVADMICDRDHGEDARTLTFDEAIRGIPGDERYPAINRSTSPGYGWTKIGKGKTYYLGTDEFVIRDEVRVEYDKVLARLRRGERSGLYWTDTLKDELRPLEKVEAGKTRLFSAGEMVQTILLRQFFMGFNAHMARHAIQVESCVGINPYSYDWTAIAKKLEMHGPNVVAGDFTNYDGTLPADGLWAVLDVINAFYGGSGEENKIRALLWLEIVNSVHIQGDMVYSWTHSQPSGCPFTSILNSVLHSILVRVAFLLAAKKYAPEKASLAVFSREVSHINYGDDDVTNVSQDIEWFNQITMAEAYKTFGMVYTDETKTGELVKFRTLKEIQFLKRSFSWDAHQSRYLAPLDINTIREMPCWNKTKGDQYLLTASVLEDAVYELAQHPRAVFEQEIGAFEIARRFVSQRHPFYLATFDEIRYVDACRYTIPGAVSKTALKLGDRGTGLMAETTSAANPAPVAQHPVRGYVASEGGVFTPSGGCVPSYNNRLTALPTTASTESLMLCSNRLANQNEQTNRCVEIRRSYASLSQDERRQYREYYLAQTDRPTMCGDSFSYKSPEDQASYIRVAECGPCDFHRSEDYEVARTIFRRWVDETYGMDVVDAFTGVAQAGEESGTEAVPNFAGGEAHVDMHEVMKFSQDGDMEAAERELNAPTPVAVKAGAEDQLENGLKDFLRRPFHMQDFVWTTGATPGTSLFTLNLPSNWINKTMIKEKIQGFRYLRCTLVCEMQINAQPMNQGAALLWFNPLAQQNAFQPSSTGHFGGIMGYPHVIYKVGTSTTVQVRIPFFPLTSHFDLARGYGTMGQITGTVFSALAGSDDVDGTVFMWAEEVELSMPTGLPLALTGVAQAGAAKERKRPGTVETAAKTLGSVTNVLSKVPVIGSFASVADTVLGGVGAIASAFGWSKPTDPEYTTEVGVMFGRQMANFNGDAKPKILALDAKNVCNVPVDVFNTDKDEMSFNEILSKPVYADRFTIANSTEQGTLVHSWPVTPSACVKTASVDADFYNVFRRETYLSYLSSLARFWRGGLKFRYMFVKTPFHSGRVRFTYVPGATVTTDFSTIDLNKCYSEVHDLRSESEVEFTIPFNYFLPWALTDESDSILRPIATWTRLCYTTPPGMVYVSIVNALRNPTTVSSSIEVLMMVSAAEDFQFAVPYCQPGVHPISRASDVPPAVMSGVAQANFFETKAVEEEVNATTIGELFTGFRQWLKRYHLIPRDAYSNVTRPFLIDYTLSPGSITLQTDYAKGSDPFRRTMPLYRFMSGAMRVLYPNNQPYTASSNPGLIAGTVVPSDVQTGVALAATTDFERLMEFEIPFYQPFPAIATQLGNPQISYPDSTVTPSIGNFTQVPYNQGTHFDVTPPIEDGAPLYRAISENFSFGFLVGVPVTVIRTDRPGP